MRALVMAAGLGTRLKPLTDSVPKPLVPVLGRPMVEHVLELLATGGVTEALINIHYFPEQMRAFVEGWNKRGGVPRLSVQDESKEILGSGGAISLASSWLFEGAGTALICNSDVIAVPDLLSMEREHRKLAAQGVECTLSAVAHPEVGSKYNGMRVRNGRVISFERPGQPDPALLHFPGYYLLEQKAAKRLPPAGAAFSIVDELWKPLVEEGKLGAWIYNGYYFDLGTPEDLRIAEESLKDRRGQ